MNRAVRGYLSRIGRKGGGARTEAKRVASRSNGKLGGRRGGIRDWTSFFDAVDSARAGRGFQELETLFRQTQSRRTKAVLNATARALADELGMHPPRWAISPLWLRNPYFVAGIENLKASSLLESPADFRMNHVFVLANFLRRV